MLYLDIFDSSDDKLGPGPVFNVGDVSVADHLDEAGEVLFSVPAGDVRLTSTLCHANASYVEVVYDHPQAGLTVVGRGLVADGERRLLDSIDGPRYQYRLPSLLHELAWACSQPFQRYDDVDANDILNDQLISGNLYGLLASQYGASGWDAGDVDALGNVTLELAGESVLEAIRKLAEELGLHFRENPDTKRRVDFGAFGDSSGIRAVQAQMASVELQNNDTILLLQDLEVIEENEEIYNWVLPLGGGSDPANQLTLEHSTRSSPYTIQTTTAPDNSTTLYYIKTGSGNRRRVQTWRDITPASDDAGDLENAANQLYDAAAAWLADHASANTTYRARVVDMGGVDWDDLIVGNKLLLDYHGTITYIDGSREYIDLDTEVMIVSRTRRYDTDGRVEITLELSTGERRPGSNAAIVRDLARRQRQLSLHPQAGWDGAISSSRVSGAGGSAVVGSGAAGRVAYWTAADTLSGEAALAYDATNDILTVTGTTRAGNHSGGHYAAFATDGELTLHGNARVYKNDPYEVGGFQAPGTKPATLVDHGIAVAWEFSDGTDDTITADKRLPQDMDRTVAPEFVIGWDSDTADPGDDSKQAVWQLEYLYRASNEDMTAVADDTLSETASASTTANGLVTTTFTLAAPSASDKRLLVRIKRLGADGDDDLGDVAYLVGCGLKYTVDKLGVAL